MIRDRVVVASALLLVVLAVPAAAQNPPASSYLGTWTATIRPNDIAADPEDGSVAIIDAGESSIEILRPGGSHKRLLPGFKDPRCAAYLHGGVLLVGEAGSGTVRGYDRDGHVVLTLGSAHGEFVTPNDVAVHPGTGRIFVVDSAADVVKGYRSSDGAFELAFGTTGSGAGELRFPISVAVSAALNEVFVGDSRNRRIAVFDAGTGAFHRNIGEAGGGDGEISFVGGLQIDGEQRLYVVESLGGFVQLLTPEGSLLGTIGEHGNGPGQLRSPKAVQIDRYNRLLVTSFLDRRVEVWGLDDFQNPVDQDITILAQAVPDHVHPALRSFQVVFQVQGIDPGEIEPDSLRVNGSVRPLPDSYRVGPHLTVRFGTTEVLATLPPGSSSATLKLTGETRDGIRFESGIEIRIVPVPPEPGAFEGGEP